MMRHTLRIAGWMVALGMVPLSAHARRAVLAADSPRAWAVARQALEELGPGHAVALAGAESLALAEALRTLRGLQALYARSEFDACAQQASLAERGLAEHRAAGERTALTALKQLDLWLGLCRQAAGDTGQAREAYLLAARLPGPGPDADLFPPEAMRLFQQATKAAGPRCPLRLPPAVTTLELDGQPAKSAAELAAGDHYAAWSTGERASAARVRVAKDCRIPLPRATASPGPLLAPGLDLAAQGAWLTDLGQAEAASLALLVSGGTDALQVVVARVEQARVIERSQATVGPDQAASKVLASLLRRLLGPSPSLTVSPPPASSIPSASAIAPTSERAIPPPVAAAPPRRWYRSWWAWTLIGAGVAVAVAVPLAITLSGSSGGTTPPPAPRYDLVF